MHLTQARTCLMSSCRLSAAGGPANALISVFSGRVSTQLIYTLCMHAVLLLLASDMVFSQGLHSGLRESCPKFDAYTRLHWAHMLGHHDADAPGVMSGEVPPARWLLTQATEVDEALMMSEVREMPACKLTTYISRSPTE